MATTLDLSGRDGAFIREITHRTYVNAKGETPVHDSSAAFYLLRPECYTTVEGRVRVVPDGIAAGQTMIGTAASEHPAYAGRPIHRVAVGVDTTAVLDLYRNTLLQAA